MKWERGAAAAAVLAALTSLACCLPIGLLGAVGLAGASVWAGWMRPWLLGASAVFLVAGFVQIYRRTACARRSRTSIVVFWIAAALVLAIFLFPQALASLIAG